MGRSLRLKAIWAMTAATMLVMSAGETSAQDNTDVVKRTLGGIFQRLQERRAAQTQQEAGNGGAAAPAAQTAPPSRTGNAAPKHLGNAPPDIVGVQLKMTPEQVMAAVKARPVYTSVKKYMAALEYAGARGLGAKLPGSDYLKEIIVSGARRTGQTVTASDQLTVRFSPLAGEEHVVAVSRAVEFAFGASTVTPDALMQAMRGTGRGAGTQQSRRRQGDREGAEQGSKAGPVAPIVFGVQRASKRTFVIFDFVYRKECPYEDSYGLFGVVPLAAVDTRSLRWRCAI